MSKGGARGASWPGADIVGCSKVTPPPDRCSKSESAATCDTRIRLGTGYAQICMAWTNLGPLDAAVRVGIKQDIDEVR